MAKRSMIVKDARKAASAAKYRKKRVEYRDTIKSVNSTPEQREEARRKLNNLPRLSLETRVCNRCLITGRPRGYLRKFKMSRISFRVLANQGLIPGVTKSSW